MTITRIGIVKGLMLTTGLAGLLASAPASAQASRTWVSGVGDDANPCSRTAPCKTFAGAISKTAASGEINCLDPGAFGAVTITKSITIDCQGIGTAGIVAGGTSGIVVQAGASDAVVIDGLDINGVGTGTYGVNFVSGGSLVVRNTSIRNFTAAGVNVAPTGSSSLRAVIDRSLINNSAIGVLASGSNTSGSVFVTVRASNVTNSATYGIETINGAESAAAFSTIMVDDTTVSGSTSYGLYASGVRAGMLVNNATITNNLGGGVGTANGGVMYTYRDNRVNGNNQNDGSFTNVAPLR